jgi:hypothetical protein
MDRDEEIKRLADQEEQNIIQATMLGDYDPSRTNLQHRCGICYKGMCRTKLRFVFHPEIKDFETAACEECISRHNLTISDTKNAREFEAITIARLRFHKRR